MSLAAVAALVVITLAIVPPNTLPYGPDSQYSDAAIVHWPYAHFFQNSIWTQGQWPLWNPSRMLGQPFAANPQSHVYYPPQWLALFLPTTLHLDVMLYLHMLWLALGMVAWARAERLRALTGLFAALLWGLSPLLAAHLSAGHMDFVYGAAWLPWLLVALRRLIDAPTATHGIGVGLTAAFLLLAGPQIAAYLFAVAGIFGLSSLKLKKTMLSNVAGWGSALLVFLVLSAVVILPLVALSPFLTRAHLTPHDAAIYSLPVSYLIGLVVPDLASGNYEWMLYIGLPALGLAAAASLRWRVQPGRWLWWAGALAALMWSLGENGPLFLPVAERIPLITWFRVPPRALFVFAFCVVILACRGFDDLFHREFGGWGRLACVGTAFAGSLGLAALSFVPGIKANARGVLVGAGVALIATGAALWVAGGGVSFVSQSARRRWRLAGIAAVFASQMVIMLCVDLALVKARPIEDVRRPEQAIINRLDASCGSVYSPSFQLIGPATVASGVVTLHGIEPIQIDLSARAIMRAAGAQPGGYSVLSPPLDPTTSDLSRVYPDLPALARLGVCEVVTDKPIPTDGLRLIDTVGAVSIYRIGNMTPSSPGEIFLKPLPIGIIAARQEVCAESTAGLMVTIRQSWAPGWQIMVDGKPVQPDPEVMRRDGIMSVRMASPGCHEIEYSYRPQADLAGMAISGAGALGLGSWFFVRRKRSDDA